MSHLARRITNIFFAFVLAIMSVNLSGVLTLQNAHAAGTYQPAWCQFTGNKWKIQIGGDNDNRYPLLMTDAIRNLGNSNVNAAITNGQQVMMQDQSPRLDPSLCATQFTLTIPTPTVTGVCGTKNDIVTVVDNPNYTWKFNNDWSTSHGVTTGTVTLTATKPYEFTNGKSSATITVTEQNTTACDVTITNLPVSHVTGVCGLDNDTIVVGAETSQYSAGVATPFVNGVATVTYTAKTGFVFAGGSKTYVETVTELNRNACIINDATATVTPTTAATCNAASDVTVTTTHATLVGTLNKTPGTHTATFAADAGHAFAGGSTTLVVQYVINPHLTGEQCLQPVTPTAPTWNDVCGGVDHDTFTIPSVPGVTYYIKISNLGWAPIKAGTYPGFSTVVIKAVANNGYKLTDYTGPWSQTFSNDACRITAADPTMTDECGAAHDSYTIPTSEHVVYKKLVGYFLFIIPIYQTVTADTYPGTGTVTIVAFSDSDAYYISGQTKWVFTFDATSCDSPVTPEAPVVKTDSCGTKNDTYAIPETTGVDYYVDGVIVPAGEHSTNGAALITVTAVAQKGYILDENASSWPLVFDTTACKPQPCVPTTVDFALMMQQNTKPERCPGNGNQGQPSTSATVVTELPQTGPADGNTLVKIATIIAAGILTYGAMFYLVNRRELSRK